MHGALHVAKTGLSAQDLNLKVISNNLANASTVGFKKDRAVFEDLLYQTRRQPGANSSQDSVLPSGLQIGSGVRAVGTQKMFTEGDLQITEQTFDLAINGRGFFQILKPDGQTAYTRNGEFSTDADGRIVTSEGYPLEPEIVMPANVTSVTIGNDGTVTAIVSQEPEPVGLGTLELADFTNPQGLMAIGQNLFLETAASGAAVVSIPGEDSTGILKQGMLEGSNVNAVEELVDMITTQRAYEMNSKVISTADQMLSFITQQL
jgi:flagellar basal-body rod protein FlgG